ncbi:murein hydrolase activator EnvC family protein [Modicisalibacter radicis]|uniref:murein hydrolase activator EnvC family protein n=1 Tax=Halomonas sp. EAR18 TaxID=2518972 RepID=UPI001FCE5CB8|nr:peptidoglycan DD-metalloendopeptidase family protein [Halomonas sp. EAR18]
MAVGTLSGAARAIRDTALALVAGAVLLVAGGPAATAQSVDKDDAQAAEARVDALGKDLEALGERLAATREARSDASEALAKVETRLAELHRRLASLEDERRRLDGEIAELESRREALRERRREQLDALAKQLDALYRVGNSPQLKLLLNQDEPGRLDRLQTYLNHLSRARARQLDELARLDTRLAETRATLDQRRQRLAELVEEAAEQRSALDRQAREREALVAKLDARYSDEQSRQRALASARSEAERRLARIREELERLDRPPPSTAIDKTRGDLPWPVQGRIVSAYGSGEGVDRNGLVIAAAAGTPIKAIHAGRVVFADWMRGFGNLLIIDHGDDVMSLYAHVQRFDVAVGAPVANDQTVAAVGASGGRSDPALYFEIRKNGEPIDPRRWISQR